MARRFIIGQGPNDNFNGMMPQVIRDSNKIRRFHKNVTNRLHGKFLWESQMIFLHYHTRLATAG